MTADRHLEWEGCYNLRELGGLPTRDGGRTAYGVFVRGDSVCRLTDRGRRDLLEYGIRTVVDLRSDRELEREPNPFAGLPRALTYVHRPMNDPATDTSIGHLPTGADRYRSIVDASGERITQIAHALAEAEGAVLFHCFGGRDRTGIVSAILLRLAGVPDDVIVADYEVTDERMQPLYEEWRAEMDAARRERFDRAIAEAGEPIRAALEHFDERYGGVERYLRRHGALPFDIDRLRSRLLG